MLTRLHVQGYKALRDIDTTLEPLTVIVGPNGCGKTSVLESIALVRDFEVKGTGEASKLHLIEEIGSKDLPADAETSIELWAGTTGTNATPTLPSSSETEGLRFELKGLPSKKKWNGATTDPEHEALARTLFESFVGRIRRLEFDANVLAQPSYLQEVVPRIGDDGSGLATVLSTLIGEQREKFDEIQAGLREFVPELERIRLRPASIAVVESQDVPVGLDEDGKEVVAKRRYQREVIGNEILLDFRHAKGVPAKHASEGTLLLLGLLTVVHTGSVSTLLLDDVDRALHPKAQQQLVAYLRKLTERGVQVIATTHSPYLVLHLEYEEVRAMTMSDSGGALIGKLTDHPEYARWREEMTPSEFWTVFGEEWLTRAKAFVRHASGAPQARVCAIT